jgi:hypothetical protein
MDSCWHFFGRYPARPGQARAAAGAITFGFAMRSG